MIVININIMVDVHIYQASNKSLVCVQINNVNQKLRSWSALHVLFLLLARWLSRTNLKNNNEVIILCMTLCGLNHCGGTEAVKQFIKVYTYLL